ncbi:hypothetical protein IQ249_15155 [Lusitaniella coriacea LEGE 07157]|uniref:ATP-binding protein n=1 Tax=Lusitaniella coriacea LEGE 07157 TaxID=945747 RepID=A0A8J7DXW2_9CYAN|nr:hypothetical protein [Lusitaniella coriacea]MBE9117237.1 hypothetical protein [Lusitaniella coriacea LEGE 07157]
MSRRFERSQRIRARASQKALKKVTCLFNASLKDILQELLQNARRSGATEVAIVLLQSDERHRLSLSDNGHGLDDPAVLLTLGESEWSEEIAQGEDPAGMGFFSLANRGTEIHSNGWCVNLSPSHFQGEAEAEVSDSTRERGTEIVFPVTEAEISELQKVLEEVSFYYPLPVTFEGEVLKREDFLARSFYIEEWRGLRIGVTHCRSYALKVNFYGIAIEHVFPHTIQVSFRFENLTVLVDVVDCPELELVLPSRKDIVQNEFLKKLHDEVRCIIYRYLRTQASHRLQFDEWQTAARLGIVLPEAEAKLNRFVPEIADLYLDCSVKEVEVGDNTLLLDIWELDADRQQVFWWSFKRANLPHVALCPESAYKGYSWYDRLPSISEFSFTINMDGEDLNEEQVRQRYPNETSLVVDGITVSATVQKSDGSSEVISWATDVYVARDPF